jgi:hypothetical protein
VGVVGKWKQEVDEELAAMTVTPPYLPLQPFFDDDYAKRRLRTFRCRCLLHSWWIRHPTAGAFTTVGGRGSGTGGGVDDPPPPSLLAPILAALLLPLEEEGKRGSGSGFRPTAFVVDSVDEQSFPLVADAIRSPVVARDCPHVYLRLPQCIDRRELEWRLIDLGVEWLHAAKRTPSSSAVDPSVPVLKLMFRNAMTFSLPKLARKLSEVEYIYVYICVYIIFSELL